MLAIWYQFIIYGRKTFKQAPQMVREELKQALIDGGLERLIEE